MTTDKLLGDRQRAAGPAYHLIGFDTLTFTPTFVTAPIPGWTAHIAEQLTANSLIRPSPPTTAPTNAR